MSEELEKFRLQKQKQIESNLQNERLVESARQFNTESNKAFYSYNFSWMGRPIIAYPQDMIAMQEIIWEVKPDLIIETGIAHGGSIIYYASLLELIGSNGMVVGIDIDIRKHNRELIEQHPMFKRITLLEGSSIDSKIVEKVCDIAKGYKKVMVCLDSNHTHSHVLEELRLYSPLVTVDSYCIVFDTIVEFLPADYMPGGRPWNPGNNPYTAVKEFLMNNDHFKVDNHIDSKLMISVAPGGYLKKVK